MEPDDLRALADRIESASCTGLTASWCPVLGTPMFPSDDRESADGCLAGDAFIAEVRRP